jgi:hypothetical protein
VACRVEHQTTPDKPRCVVDAQRRYAHGLAGIPRHQLPQCHRTVEQSALVTGEDADPLRRNVQRIRFGRCRWGSLLDCEHDPGRIAARALDDLQFAVAGFADEFDELTGGGERLWSRGMEEGIGVHVEATLGRRQRRRCGDQRWPGRSRRGLRDRIRQHDREQQG